MRRLAAFIRLMGTSRLSMLGAALVTSCFFADVILIGGELFLFESHPYMGIFAYLLFPALTGLGLLLIPVGIYRKVRKFGTGVSVEGLSRLVRSAGVGRASRVLQVLSVLTLVNLIFFAVVGYRSFHFTESRAFCGLLCHQVMHPEYTTYSRSPHSEVLCVNCHIGPGAGWFVKSKLSGGRQVFAVLFDTYPRPIETPIENLRPAREVCEVCHRPAMFTGDLIRILESFKPDEANTRLYTVLNLRVGRGGGPDQPARGIHWHVSDRNQVRYYAADRKRERIVRVELTRADGSQHVWTRPDAGVSATGAPPEKLRLMDCVDCHNRPTHIFQAPERALDARMADGSLDPSIPWLRRLSEEVLVAEYDSTQSAMAGIATLPQVYEQRYPDAGAAHRDGILAAVGVLQEIYRDSVFPEMKIGWNTYPSLIGHPTRQTARCFRCHGSDLRDEQGAAISLDCESCHYILADADPNPPVLKILEGQ